jgi:hypothetical protein
VLDVVLASLIIGLVATIRLQRSFVDALNEGEELVPGRPSRP